MLSRSCRIWHIIIVLILAAAQRPTFILGKVLPALNSLYHYHETKYPTLTIQLQAVHSVTKNTDGDISEKMDGLG